MKGFTRDNLLFSLCGLNCGLCSMRMGGYCPGCGGGEGNQSCRIARCAMERGDVEYCFLCEKYPCENYPKDMDDFDSFLTRRGRKRDIARAKRIGLERYTLEQQEKVRILALLLSEFDDGCRKTLYYVGVNLLELPVLRQILHKLEPSPELEKLTPEERSGYAAQLFQQAAQWYGIELQLRKKKKRTKKS